MKQKQQKDKKILRKFVGTQERFTMEYNYHIFECFLKKLFIQDGWELIQLTCYMNGFPEENFSYSALVYEYDKKVELKSELNEKLPSKIRKELNERFSKEWNVKFI